MAKADLPDDIVEIVKNLDTEPWKMVISSWFYVIFWCLMGSNKISGREIGIEYNCGKYHECGAIHTYMLGNPIYAIYLPFGNGKNSTHKK